MALSSMMHLTSAEVAALDPYAFLAVLGKRVIHPGGRRSSDEGIANCLAVMGRTMTRLSYLRKMAWLMPRLQRAVPYLGYLLVAGEKPASSQGGTAAKTEEVTEGVSPERMS